MENDYRSPNAKVERSYLRIGGLPPIGPIVSGVCAALCVGAFWASDASAQTVDHARIQQLFTVLEPDAPAPAPLKPSPPVDLALQPVPAPEPFVDAPQNDGSRIPRVPFSTKTIDGTDCPRGMPQFVDALKDPSADIAGLETAVVSLSEKDKGLYERSLEFSMSGAALCPDDLRDDYTSFLRDIAEMKVAERIYPAETLQVCAQATVTNLRRDIEAIPADAGAADQDRRLALSNLMRNLSEFDERATNGVRDLVSFEQKLQRLSSGGNQFIAQCDLFCDFEIGGDQGLGAYQ